MTIFRSRGFDTLVGKGTTITGMLGIAANSTAVIDGTAQLSSVAGVLNYEEAKVATKTTLHVNGTLSPIPYTGQQSPNLTINVHNVIITGKVECDTISVEGTLAVKSGATLIARNILYRKLIIETGAVVHGQMSHLDHVAPDPKSEDELA